ncbi:MAG: galactokinase [Actinobacteria bacterium]|nr:galactokinase [Actinomycetota bacterium]
MHESELESHRQEFARRFGHDGPDLFFAPGRVNLVGEHTDYNGGLVLPLAIGQGTCLLAREKEDYPIRLASTRAAPAVELRPGPLHPAGDWADYVRGVIHVLRERSVDVPPFDALYCGDLPLEAGLASSASLEVVTALAVASLAGAELSGEEIARAAWRAENEFVGLPCGIMDQYAVSLCRASHLLLLDCADGSYVHVPYNLPGIVIVVGHTGVRRALAASPYRQRRQECEDALRSVSAVVGERAGLARVTEEELAAAAPRLPGKLLRRARHVVEENRRTAEAARLLEEGDAEGLGRLLNLSHVSLRDLYEVSSPELDALQEISLAQRGVWGCRMTGAGFGGCVVALVDEDAVPAYLEKVPALYRAATAREPFFLVTRPRAGARKL